MVALVLVLSGVAAGHSSRGVPGTTNRDAVYIPPQTTTVTRYSAVVSGNEGFAPSGATTVTVTLNRGGRAVSTATADVSQINGTWSATLTPVATTPASRTNAPSVNQDQLVIHYSGPAAPADQLIGNSGARPQPFDLTSRASIDASGSTGEFPLRGDCSGVEFLVDGASVPTTPSGNHCVAAFATPVTDADTVTVSDTEPISDFGDTGPGRVQVVEAVGLPGKSGAPRCSADLVDATISCSHLNGRTFIATRSRGSQAVTLQYSGGSGRASATMPGGFVAGDVVTLQEQGVARVMSTLHVDTLRSDLASFGYYGCCFGTSAAGGAGTAATADTSSDCTPNKWLGIEYFGWLNFLCDVNGKQPPAPYGFPFQASVSLDDTSGGQTTIDVPDFIFVSPEDGEAVPNPFTAYADTVGPAPTSETVTVFDRNSDGSDGSQVGSARAIDPVNGVTISDLSAGRYNAHWQLVDANGDTRNYATQFVVEPTSTHTGPQGPPGPTGKTGPQGPPGPAPSIRGVKCSGHFAKHHHLKIKCRVLTSHAARDRAVLALLRGRALFALGSARVHGRAARVAMRTERGARFGAYRAVVLLVDRQGHAWRSTLTARLR